MAMRLRYSGSFVAVDGTVVRTEIWQDSDAPFPAVGDLDFPADEPLKIEWKRKDKEEVICGSAATLKVISPGDRTYIDLYSVRVGFIRLDVYKDDALYWRGTLDTEFYEEPYERKDGYDVTLTFCDFGVMDRLKYGLEGLVSLQGIVAHALERCGLGGLEIDKRYVSTGFPPYDTYPDGPDIVEGLFVQSRNFTDEDGEVCTLEETVEGILQPLALRLVQRGERVWLYDLNGLYGAEETQEIRWDGDSQTLGTDKVANNVRVTFSPYSSSKILDGELEYRGAYDAKKVNVSADDPKDPKYGTYYSYLVNQEYAGGSYGLPVDFTLFLGDKGRGLAGIGEGCRYFHIQPVSGDSGATDGVAYQYWPTGFKTDSAGKVTGQVIARHFGRLPHGLDPGKNDGGLWFCPDGGQKVMTTKRVYLPPSPGTDDHGQPLYYLRVTVEMLLDVRYNPLSGEEEYNNNKEDNGLKVNSAFVFIPAKVTLYDEHGAVKYLYSNGFRTIGPFEQDTNWQWWMAGQWLPWTDTDLYCWLEYYNPEDLNEDAGIRGWQTNRQNIGRPDGLDGRYGGKLDKRIVNLAAGEYIPYPPEGGYLEVEVLSGVLGYDSVHEEGHAFGSYNSVWDQKKYPEKVRWMLFKAPMVEVVRNTFSFNAVEHDDVVYRGRINADAKEEISLDTICGTLDDFCPTALGVYLNPSGFDYQQRELTRAGRTDHPEKLLVGTLYSQYAERKTTLSGEAVALGGLACYTEANQGKRRFMLMEEVQDVRMCCSDATFCEFSGDEYEGIEEDEED